MKSNSLRTIYNDWTKTATPPQIELVDAIFAECEEHYEDGGDTIVECYDPADILAQFKSVKEAKEFCGLKVEQSLNARWGEDSDPEVERMRKFDEWDGTGLG
jgi:hypothetical protein